MARRRKPIRKPIGAKDPRLLSLTEAQIDQIARGLAERPIPAAWWASLFPKPAPRSGRRPAAAGPDLLTFAPLFELAETKAIIRLREWRRKRRNEWESSDQEIPWRTFKDKYRHPAPVMRDVVLESLREWGVWRKSMLPSPRTLAKYRRAFSASASFRELFAWFYLPQEVNLDGARWTTVRPWYERKPE